MRRKYNRRPLIKTIGGAGVAGAPITTAVADPETDDETCPPSGCGGGGYVDDYEQDEWSGDNGVLRPNIYTEHRGYKTTRSKLVNILFDRDDDRALFRSIRC